MTVNTLKERLDAGEQIRLVDCREPNEYEAFNLGGMLLPLGKIQGMEIDSIMEWKNEEVIIHCRSGQRSMMAAMFLEAVGFTNVVNLAGGVMAWQEAFGTDRP